MNTEPTWMAEVVFDENGLIPAIAQDAETGQILMVAWMSREALAETAATGRAVYWSRRASACGARAKSPAMPRTCTNCGWTATATSSC